MKKLILASSSPRRRDILSHIGLDFEIIAADADEENDLPKSPSALVKTLSKRKADAVLKDMTDSIVIGSDTIVYHGGKILTKPKNQKDAFDMLMSLSGSVHYVYSGLCVTDSEKCICTYVKTAVKMRDITKDEITEYINTGEPLDKAGAYGMQDLGGVFVREIRGDYYNVVGLPLEKLCEILKEHFDYDVLKMTKLRCEGRDLS